MATQTEVTPKGILAADLARDVVKRMNSIVKAIDAVPHVNGEDADFHLDLGLTLAKRTQAEMIAFLDQIGEPHD